MKLWLGTIRQWHWVSSAICLLGMLLFALTGITLNHAGQIEGNARVETVEQVVPEEIMASVRMGVAQSDSNAEAPLPGSLRRWLRQEAGIITGDRLAEWDDYELYLSMPRPGGDAWLSIELDSGELLYEKTTRGVVSYLNDLHKGRNTGMAWSWFLDLFSISCVVFCVSGLILLQRHSGVRPATWPMVGLGVVIPALIVLLTIHS